MATNLIVQQRFENECTAATIANINPCGQCASDRQLWAALLYLFARYFNLQNSIQDLMADATDTLQLSDRAMLEAVVTIMGQSVIGNSGAMSEVLAQIKCLECADPKLVRGTTLKLWCEFWRLRLLL